MISESETEQAMAKTRLLLTEKKLEESLVHLDMIESEWNDVREQYMNGLLDIDDQLRLQNISRAKLMQLLLDVGGYDHISANLRPENNPANRAEGRQSSDRSFREGLKTFIGVALMLPSAGALFSKNWAAAACFGIAAIVTFPPGLRFIEKSIRYELRSWHKYLLVSLSLLAAGSVYAPKETDRKKEAPVEKSQ